MTGEPTAPGSQATEGTENADSGDSPQPLSKAYRHDIHKLFGRKHITARDEYDGTPINERVPLRADGEAALLSRPAGNPEQTVSNHYSPRRLSLLTGSSPPEADRLKFGLPWIEADIEQLIARTDPEVLHAEWLTDTLSAAVNESMYYPYTSLKYHTLLVAALLDNYRAGHTFDELSLVATEGEPTAGAPASTSVEEALESEAVRPHRTVCWTPAVTLHVTGKPGDRPATLIGEVPVRSFADAWARLPEHPLDTDGARKARLLDAQLRRIRSWSTALQYIEDATRGLGPLPAWGEADA